MSIDIQDEKCEIDSTGLDIGSIKSIDSDLVVGKKGIGRLKEGVVCVGRKLTADDFLWQTKIERSVIYFDESGVVCDKWNMNKSSTNVFRVDLKTGKIIRKANIDGFVPWFFKIINNKLIGLGAHGNAEIDFNTGNVTAYSNIKDGFIIKGKELGTYEVNLFGITNLRRFLINRKTLDLGIVDNILQNNQLFLKGDEASVDFLKKKPIFVSFANKGGDPKGAYENSHYNGLDKYYNILYFEVENEEDLIQNLQLLIDKGIEPSVVDIAGHGSPKDLLLGNKKSKSETALLSYEDYNDFISLRGKFPNTDFYLMSCSTGGGSDNGVGEDNCNLVKFLYDTLTPKSVSGFIKPANSGDDVGYLFDNNGVVNGIYDKRKFLDGAAVYKVGK